MSGKDELSHAGQAALAGGLAAPAASKKMKARADRVRLSDSSAIKLLFKGTGEILEIQNISVSGVALASSQFSLGETLPCELRIQEKIFPLEIQIVHCGSYGSGAHFLNPTLELVMNITGHLQAELLGIRVVQVSQQFMKASEVGEAIWFEGEKKSGLYYVIHSGKVISFTLSALGHVVEWAEGTGLKFGQMVNNPDSRVYESGSKQTWKQSWPESTRALLQKFASNIPALDKDHLTQILSRVAQIPTGA
jgi:hypothetical protein